MPQAYRPGARTSNPAGLRLAQRITREAEGLVWILTQASPMGRATPHEFGILVGFSGLDHGIGHLASMRPQKNERLNPSRYPRAYARGTWELKPEIQL